MGGSQSQEESDINLMNIDLTDYQYIRSVYDPRFGSVKILENKRTKEEVMSKTTTLKSKEERDQLILLFQGRQKLIHFNLQKMYGYVCRDDSDICGEVWTISQFNEYISYDLDQEIKKRSEANEYFEENDIWYLIESISNLCYYLKCHYCYHGEIKPINILLNKDGPIKLHDNILNINGNKAYFKTTGGIDKGYLSPQQLNAIARGESQPIYDEEKADMYALGMTILYSATLQNVQKCYDWENFKIIDSNLEKLLNSICSRYSETIYNTIKKMLSYTEASRFDFEDLKSLNFPKIERRSVTVNHRQSVLSRVKEYLMSDTSQDTIYKNNFPLTVIQQKMKKEFEQQQFQENDGNQIFNIGQIANQSPISLKSPINEENSKKTSRNRKIF